MRGVEIIDPRFRRYVHGNAEMERIAEGCRWAEGPVWFGDGGYLLWSDIPNNRIMRWIEGVGVSVFRQPSQFANGGTRDREGRLVSCLHGARAVIRTEHDGSVTTLADRYEGKRLNSPNDVVVTSDGAVWFTDPHYGIAADYEGGEADEEIPCHVYRLDPLTAALRIVTDAFDCPNGLCFSPDGSLLYIAETGRMHDHAVKREIRVFPVLDLASGKVGEGRHFYAPAHGIADGFRADQDGNIWTSAGDGVHCVTPDGELLGKLLTPRIVSNVCFGGRHRGRLFICATDAVHAIYLHRRGASPP